MNRYPVFPVAQSWNCNARFLFIAALGLSGGALIGCGSSSTNTTSDGGFPYVANLTQAQETPPTGSTAAGTASFTVNTDKTQIQYSVTHNVSGGTAAHLHSAAGGNAGDIVISLNYSANSFSGTAALSQQNATFGARFFDQAKFSTRRS